MLASRSPGKTLCSTQCERAYIHAFIRVCVCVRVNLYMSVCVYLCRNLCTYIYIYVSIYTHGERERERERERGRKRDRKRERQRETSEVELPPTYSLGTGRQTHNTYTLHVPTCSPAQKAPRPTHVLQPAATLFPNAPLRRLLLRFGELLVELARDVFEGPVRPQRAGPCPCPWLPAALWGGGERTENKHHKMSLYIDICVRIYPQHLAMVRHSNSFTTCLWIPNQNN